MQALELLNGEQLHEMIYANAAYEVGRGKERRLVDQLYRSVLSRPATAAEKNAGRAFLLSGESEEESLKDMLWALVCSPEFQYIK